MFEIGTKSFAIDNNLMPAKYIYTQAGGQNVSPEIHWKNPPSGTQSFAIICHDPDAPVKNGWFHWVVYNIPKNVSSVPEGSGKNVPVIEGIGDQGKTDFENFGYGGPCPPVGHGNHRYVFTVYALGIYSIKINTDGLEVKDALQVIKKEIESNAVASVSFIKIYRRD